jgi:hypothetical protein
MLHNTFSSHTPDDIIYHLGNCCNQLGIAHDAFSIKLSGDSGVESETFKLFQHYFPDVSIHFGFAMPKVDLPLGDLRKQQFMSLLNQFSCV